MKARGQKSRLWRKLTDRNGLSLLEMLFSIIALIIVSAMLITGMTSAVHAYNHVLDQANAQDMLSTAVTLLRSELGAAVITAVDDLPVGGETASSGSAIEYYNPRTGGKSVIGKSVYVPGEGGPATGADGLAPTADKYGVPYGTLQLTEYGVPRTLVPAIRTSAGGRLSVTYSGISYDPISHIVTVSELCVMKGDKLLTDKMNLVIRNFGE